MRQIKASDNQRLDEIVFTEYGTLEFMEIVLENNPHLTTKLILNIGDVINLPIVTKNKIEEKEEVLW